MISLRKEIKDYASACEHLISAVASPETTPFTRDETDYLEYYVIEMAKLVDQLLCNAGPQVRHMRQAIRDYAAACEALLVSDVLSEDESDGVRQSVSDVTTKILVEKDDPPAERVRLTSA